MTPELIGWIGSVCFALCGFPQALKCHKEGHARGLSCLGLLLWLSGEVCYIISVWSLFGWVGWMMFNYLMNAACILVMLRYKFRPEVPNETK